MDEFFGLREMPECEKKRKQVLAEKRDQNKEASSRSRPPGEKYLSWTTIVLVREI